MRNPCYACDAHFFLTCFRNNISQVFISIDNASVRVPRYHVRETEGVLSRQWSGDYIQIGPVVWCEFYSSVDQQMCDFRSTVDLVAQEVWCSQHFRAIWRSD